MSGRTRESHYGSIESVTLLAKMLEAQKRGNYDTLPVLARKKLLSRLGIEVYPPRPPAEAVNFIEKLKKEDIEDMLLCYIPGINVSTVSRADYKRPDFGLLKRGSHGEYFTNPEKVKSLLSTSAGWRIVDMRPMSGPSMQYVNDSQYLGEVLRDLRLGGQLAGKSISSNKYPESRSGISQTAIKEIVAPALSTRLGIDSSMVALPTLAEANVVGNVYFPSNWQYNYNGEWFDDTVGEGLGKLGLYGRYNRKQTTHPLSVVALEKASVLPPSFIGFRLQFNFQETGAAPIGARR